MDFVQVPNQTSQKTSRFQEFLIHRKIILSRMGWALTHVLKLLHTLPETNMAPENQWLVQMNFLLGRLGPFSGAFSVSFRECNTCPFLW